MVLAPSDSDALAVSEFVCATVADASIVPLTKTWIAPVDILRVAAT